MGAPRNPFQYAIVEPSGDQAGSDAAASVVSLVIPVPSAFIV